MSIVESLLEYHCLGPLEIIEWTLLEDSGWSVGETKAYRSGFKKHQHDERVMTSLQDLLNFIMNQPKQPRIEDYPSEYRVHAIATDKRFSKGTLWCHLKGQKIGLLFQANYVTQELNLIALATHQELGWR